MVGEAVSGLVKISHIPRNDHRHHQEPGLTEEDRGEEKVGQECSFSPRAAGPSLDPRRDGGPRVTRGGGEGRGGRRRRPAPAGAGNSAEGPGGPSPPGPAPAAPAPARRSPPRTPRPRASSALRAPGVQ